MQMLIFFGICLEIVLAYQDAKRLYDDLMISYNKQRRPASNPHEPVTIKLKLRLSQIIDVHEMEQIMTCSVWLKQVWMDKRLSWNPKDYGGVSVLYIPYEMLWVPDIVLYNNADSYYNITISTKATLHYSGEIDWEPPAIFKSLCQIDVHWFPFDEQVCKLQFGSWTFSENLLQLEFFDGEVAAEEFVNEFGDVENVTAVEDGIDLSDYYPSVEWDIMSRKARRRAKIYHSCCPGNDPYIDISYFIVLRRKPLFYTVNLVFPCVGISFLTIVVFYLPSHSGEKISLCIQILVAVTLFFLLVMEIIPANSLTMPLIGKYLLFTMIMVTLSVLVTVIVLNLHFRTPTTHRMSKMTKFIFLQWLPKLLCMRRVIDANEESFRQVKTKRRQEKVFLNYHEHRVSKEISRVVMNERVQKFYNSPQTAKAFENVCFIAELMKKKDRDDKEDEDWKYVAMVVDRLFFIVLSVACVVSTMWILLQAPTLFDNRQPIDLQYRPTNITHHLVQPFET